MVQDFGAGLTVDELIGLTADKISNLNLPPGDIFQRVFEAGSYIKRKGFKSAILTEIWGDGHTVWRSKQGGVPLWVTPTGKIVRPAD